MLTREDLDAIKKRAEAATPGPWKASRERYGPQVQVGDSEWLGDASDAVWNCDDPDDNCMDEQQRWMRDAEFIAAARTDIPRLLELVEEYQAALECIAHRYELENPGSGPVRWQLPWAMHSDAEMALRGKFRQPD